MFASEHRRLTLYEAGGLAIVRAGPLYLAITLGTVPRTSSGGHFHNDLLGFELQWDGIDFIVDGGAYLYTPVPALRDAFRSTAAHSTVCVSGSEQRTWPAGVGRLFSVQRDADVRIVAATSESLSMEATYDDVRHLRSWRWTSGELRIEDQISASRPATLALNLHPALATRRIDPVASDRFRIVLERHGRQAAIDMGGVRAVAMGEGYYSEGYGRRLPSEQVHAELTGSHATSHFIFQRVAHDSATSSSMDHAEGNTL